MKEYFPKRKFFGGKVKVELDLSNYAHLKKPLRADRSKFAKKVDLASIKSDIDKLYVAMLETTPVDFKNIKSCIDKEVAKNKRCAW